MVHNDLGLAREREQDLEFSSALNLGKMAKFVENCEPGKNPKADVNFKHQSNFLTA